MKKIFAIALVIFFSFITLPSASADATVTKLISKPHQLFDGTFRNDDLTNDLFSKHDILVMPTVPATAFSIGAHQHSATEMFLADIYTVYANLVGIPAISIPLFTHSNGMPFGLQVMSASGNEIGLLSFSKTLMENK